MTNAKNRNSSDGSLHTGESIPTSEHFKRLKISRDMTPTCWDLFQKTHKTANENTWVSSKAKRIANEYERRLSERQSQQLSGHHVFMSSAGSFALAKGKGKARGKAVATGTAAAEKKKVVNPPPRRRRW
ncbi:uncharacterized protein LOC109806325 [Cajanus cajan]|uniref:uncharacterized protein LOC109806325 n=1 Tax=Cajanus cajan TaxID=3821 RepID=UPI00098DB520|nr:uncharacterized protein LOC109806325 [Cajanus cajan]